MKVKIEKKHFISIFASYSTYSPKENVNLLKDESALFQPRAISRVSNTKSTEPPHNLVQTAQPQNESEL